MANWIRTAIKHPGAFTAKAKEAHMSVSAYANKVEKPGSKASSTTKHQAALAKTLKSFHHTDHGFYGHMNVESLQSNKDSVRVIGVEGSEDCY